MFFIVFFVLFCFVGMDGISSLLLLSARTYVQIINNLLCRESSIGLVFDFLYVPFFSLYFVC